MAPHPRLLHTRGRASRPAAAGRDGPPDRRPSRPCRVPGSVRPPVPVAEPVVLRHRRRPAHRLHPADVELKITCDDVTYRSGHLSRMRYHAVLLRDRRPVAEAEAAFGCASPAVYRRLRAGAPRTALPLPQALPPRDVGRDHPHDVVLAAAGRPGRWQLRADTTHPILFDHPVDHVPGMVLLEAARQAAQALCCASHRQTPIAMDSVFTRYVEFGSPCYIEAEHIHSAGSGPRVRVRGVQDGDETFSATLTLRSPVRTQDRRGGLL
ncbi:ScbA/BarX family gamma-butyrolactone biosynthesis protein [Streptomyces nogalater]